MQRDIIFSFVDSDDYLEKDLYKNLIENNEQKAIY